MSYHSLVSFWESIPASIRTILNVTVGAAVAAAISYLVSHLSGGSIDLGALAQAVLVAAATALVRAINPADTVYGVNAAPQYAPAPAQVGPQDDVNA
jgi:hypothetical protein